MMKRRSFLAMLGLAPAVAAAAPAAAKVAFSADPVIVGVDVGGADDSTVVGVWRSSGMVMDFGRGQIRVECGEGSAFMRFSADRKMTDDQLRRITEI